MRMRGGPPFARGEKSQRGFDVFAGGGLEASRLGGGGDVPRGLAVIAPP